MRYEGQNHLCPVYPGFTSVEQRQKPVDTDILVRTSFGAHAQSVSGNLAPTAFLSTLWSADICDGYTDFSADMWSVDVWSGEVCGIVTVWEAKLTPILFTICNILHARALHERVQYLGTLTNSETYMSTKWINRCQKYNSTRYNKSSSIRVGRYTLGRFIYWWAPSITESDTFSCAIHPPTSFQHRHTVSPSNTHQPLFVDCFAQWMDTKSFRRKLLRYRAFHSRKREHISGRRKMELYSSPLAGSCIFQSNR